MEKTEGATKEPETGEKKKTVRPYPAGIKAKRLTTSSMLKRSLNKNSKKKWKPRDFMR